MKPELLLKQQPRDYSTIYVDMDSFFASVEQYRQPKLRGKPVGVATGTSMGASIVAASYDAKAMGIRTGTKVDRALELCPGLHIVCDNADSYRQVHREFMAILHNTICRVVPKGIDEACLKVPSYAQDRVAVFALVEAIKAELYNLYNEHICCSVGVASNMWLAKQAASYHKPRGFLCLTKDDLPQFYVGQKLTKLTGIGDRMARQFVNSGIYSPSDLYRASWTLMGRRFGVNGHKWYLRMRGYEVDLVPQKLQKSLGHQVTMGDHRPSTKKEITTFIIKICETLGKRVRSKELRAQAVSLSLLFDDGSYYSNKMEKLRSFDDNEAIVQYSILLLKKLNIISPLKKISITLYNLTPTWQLMFDYDQPVEHNKSISQAIDAIQNRYNDKAAARVGSFFEQSFSLNRVGFAGDLLRETTQQ